MKKPGIPDIDRIVSDPEIRGGKPTVRGTRIAVSDILSWLASGMTVEEILADWPYLTREDIMAAMRYAAQRSVSDHFGPRDEAEYRRGLEETEPGRRFAIALMELQNRLGLEFGEFCRMAGVNESELEDDLLNARVPGGAVLEKINRITQMLDPE